MDHIDETLEKFLEMERLHHGDNLEKYKGKWINLWFLKDGETHLGTTVCDSEAECVELFQLVMSEPRLTELPEIKFKTATVLKSLVSHAIPIPFKP